jgi:hypothetical protein
MMFPSHATGLVYYVSGAAVFIARAQDAVVGGCELVLFSSFQRCARAI